MDEDLVLIKTFSTKADADLAKSALEVNGIKVLIKSEDQVVPGALIHLYVNRRDFKQAQKILERDK